MLILKEYKAIIHSERWFGFFKISTLLSSLLFHNPNVGFVFQIFNFFHWKINLYVLQHTLLGHLIKLSFNFYLFMFKGYPHSNSLKLIIRFLRFSVAFLTKACDCRLSLSIILLSCFHWTISHFLDLIWLSS